MVTDAQWNEEQWSKEMLCDAVSELLNHVNHGWLKFLQYFI